MSFVKYLAIFAILIVVMTVAHSVSGDESLTLYWENDGTVLKPNDDSDRHYTDGIKLIFTTTNQPDNNTMRDFGRWNNFGDEGGNVNTSPGYFIAQKIFTPDYINKPNKRRDREQVFAGWLYGGIFAQRATDKAMEHFELDAGVIGPSALAKETQDLVHKTVNIDRARGWDEQLDDEFAANFTWFRRELLDTGKLRRTSDFDTQLEYGFTAGSVYRNANVGLIFRLGRDIPNDFGPGRLEAPASTCGPISDDRSYFYFFSRMGSKFVEYNRFLTGLDTEPIVGQLQLGAVWRKKDFEISYSQTYLTREYDEQPEANSYASLNLSVFF